MHYTLDFNSPIQQYVKVSIQCACEEGINTFHLSKWRPGRYVFQQFDRLITDLQASDEKGNVLELTKTGTHSWELTCNQAGSVELSYIFYCNNSDAGGSYVDKEGIYINGINLFLYKKEALQNICTLSLDLPEGYEVAGGLQKKGEFYHFSNFHQLVDSPFFAGKNLIKHSFEVAGIPMYLWFQGDCKPNLLQMQRDITAYTEAQLKIFAEFPVHEYHYLYVILPYPYRHGVEHYNSTVIAMGPGHKLMQSPMYKSFLEISSHELFHTWNVKALRPADMLPYRYEEENYSKLHYITEGVTTYYGDLMLWKGFVWNLKQWIESINGELRRHYGMGGKDYISLEEASFNSWVNGYTKEGIPNRRISFYTKGNIVSMLIDGKIREATQNKYSLDTVIALLYHRITKANRGYTKEDYLEILEEVSGISFEGFFEKYISGIEDLKGALTEFGKYMGLELIDSPPERLEKIVWGLISSNLPGSGVKIEDLLPGSPLSEAGLHIGDKIIAINKKEINKDLEHLLGFFADETEVELHYFHRNTLNSIIVPLIVQKKYLLPQFVLIGNPSPSQMLNRQSWQKVNIFQPSEHA